MTENCLVRVHQEMDERENSLHVVREMALICVGPAAKLYKDNRETAITISFQTSAPSL